ncbi:MAG: hypothetical protein JXQ82_08950 [Methanomicrobiaceae archaeon]|nr:hypothetical protein [Methanomicrobiaceae archaeon]
MSCDLKQQEEVKKKTEELFELCSTYRFPEIEKELLKLGYIQNGSDPASAEFENFDAELKLDVEFDDKGGFHSYELLTYDDIAKKQREYRW